MWEGNIQCHRTQNQTRFNLTMSVIGFIYTLIVFRNQTVIAFLGINVFNGRSVLSCNSFIK